MQLGDNECVQNLSANMKEEEFEECIGQDGVKYQKDCYIQGVRTALVHARFSGVLLCSSYSSFIP
jgi:hypothetical protein